jgi:hypothetical protein
MLQKTHFRRPAQIKSSGSFASAMWAFPIAIHRLLLIFRQWRKLQAMMFAVLMISGHGVSAARHSEGRCRWNRGRCLTPQLRFDLAIYRAR